MKSCRVIRQLFLRPFEEKYRLWDFAYPIIGTSKDSGRCRSYEKEVFRMMEVEFRFVRGHVEVYSEEGRFLFSADTVSEARMELMEDAA